MNTKTLYGLIVTVIIALVAAIAITASKKPQTEADLHMQYLLPELREHLNEINAVTLIGANEQVIATLKRNDQGWNVAEKAGYPADVTKLREFLLKLSEASLIEQKTSNKEKYADLGVSEVKDKEAKGVLVTLEGLNQPLKVIIGNYNGSGGGGTFVRRDGEAPSYLVRGNIMVDKTTANWLKRELTDIPATRLKEVAITHPDGKTLKAYKETIGDANFKLTDLPKGREPSSDVAASALASVLAGLRFDDVLPPKDIQPIEKVYKVIYSLFDGIKVEVQAWESNGKDFARFHAAFDVNQAEAQIKANQDKAKLEYAASQTAANQKAFDAKPTTGAEEGSAKSATAQKDSNAEAAAKAASEVAKPLAVSDPTKDHDEQLAALNKEVSELNKLFGEWTFVLPNYKFANMNKSMDDMLKPLEQGKSGNSDANKFEIKKPESKLIK